MPERLCISEKVSRSAKRMSRIISLPCAAASNNTSSKDKTEAWKAFVDSSLVFSFATSRFFSSEVSLSLFETTPLVTPRRSFSEKSENVGVLFLFSRSASDALAAYSGKPDPSFGFMPRYATSVGVLSRTAGSVKKEPATST